MIKVLLLILLAELWGNAGQIFYKKSVNKIGPPNLRDINAYLNFVKKVIKTPMIWYGFAFIGTGLAIWLLALAQAPLSFAFPIASIQYAITLVTAQIFLGEKINRLKLTGTLFVMAGILLVAVS